MPDYLALDLDFTDDYYCLRFMSNEEDISGRLLSIYDVFFFKKNKLLNNIYVRTTTFMSSSYVIYFPNDHYWLERIILILKIFNINLNELFDTTNKLKNIKLEMMI